MHIVLFVDYHVSSIGGVASSVTAQAEALEAAGHTVTVVCPPPTAPGTGSLFHCIILPASKFMKPNSFPMVIPSRRVDKTLNQALSGRPPVDIVHVQTNLGVGITGVRYAKRHKLPLVQTMHGRDDVFAETTYRLPYPTTLAARWSHRLFISHQPHDHLEGESKTAKNAWAVMVNHARAADHVVIPSQHFAEKFRRHGLGTPITVVSNGIREPLIRMLETSRQKKYSPHEPLKIVWIGRVSPEKRPFESIKAVEKLPHCTLDLYGDGPLLEEVNDYVKKNGLSKQIRVKGRMSQDEIVRNLVKYDLLLYPSYGFDNQPMVLLESTIAGVPVVYCDPDLAECMPGGGALLTKSPEIRDIARAVKQLATDHPSLKRMHAAMVAGSSSVSQATATRQMIRVYRKLLERP